jgi:hypothetical protein
MKVESKVFVRDNAAFRVDVAGCCRAGWHNKFKIWDRGSAWEELAGTA